MCAGVVVQLWTILTNTQLSLTSKVTQADDLLQGPAYLVYMTFWNDAILSDFCKITHTLAKTGQVLFVRWLRKRRSALRNKIIRYPK